MKLSYEKARKIVAVDNPKLTEKSQSEKQLIEPIRVHARFILDNEQANADAKDSDLITERSLKAIEEFQRKLFEEAGSAKQGIEELL